MLFGAMPFQNPELEREEAIKIANRWLAKFAPLLDISDHDNGSTLRYRLKTLEELRKEGESTRQLAFQHDLVLADTVAKAFRQLGDIEEDIRTRLGYREPGNPEGNVNLDALRSRLAERDAKTELEAELGELPESQKTISVPGNPIGGLFMGIFGLGWTSFTTVHAIFMIGGMAKAFGWAALGLLLFYSIFFAVGFGMLYGAFRTAAKEELDLEPGTLVQRLKFGFIQTRKRLDFIGRPVARIERTNVNSDSAAQFAINIWDEKGKRLTVAPGVPRELQQQICNRLNAHFSRPAA